VKKREGRKKRRADEVPLNDTKARTYLISNVCFGVPPHEFGEEGDHGSLPAQREGVPHHPVEPEQLGIRVNTQEHHQTIQVCVCVCGK